MPRQARVDIPGSLHHSITGGFRSWQGKALLSAVVAAILIQSACIFPYTPVARKEVLSAPEQNPESTVSLLVANVLMSNRRTDRLLRMIAELRPDIVLLLKN